MSWDEVAWDGMGRCGVWCHGMGWDEMRCGEMGLD